MSKLKLCSLAIFSLFALNAYAEKDAPNPMVPPQPLNNAVYDSMIGTWSGESNMMGEKTKDTVKISWALNHQFILLELKAVNAKNSKTQYEGMGVFGVDEKGQPKIWWYDSWGASAMAVGDGSFKDNTLVINDKNQAFKEVRSFTVNGKQMTMQSKGSFINNGKETPFDQTVVYKKVS